MTRYLSLTLSQLFITAALYAQVNSGLMTWISFDKADCAIVDEFGDPGIQVFTNGTFECECGVQGNSLRLNGDEEWFLLYGNKVEDVFSTIDFSLSFYFKPLSEANTPGNQSLFSKRFDCSNENAFFINYRPSTRQIQVELLEAGIINGSLSYTLSGSCWYHIVVVRKGGTTLLYVNTREVAKTVSAGNQRVNISNDELLTVGSSKCGDINDYDGLIDEIRLYNRALSVEDVQDLYLFPDQIATGLRFNSLNDTTIYLGNTVQLEVRNTCASGFLWSPTDELDDPNSDSPLATPTTSTTYVVVLSDQLSTCRARDSIVVNVVDPTTIDCNDILLPSAFTPNADGLNDGFGISNPFSAGEILSFQIFDRWGNVVFETTNPLEKWDGSYKGRPVNPSTFLYRIQFRCQGVEDFISGDVTVIR